MDAVKKKFFWSHTIYLSVAKSPTIIIMHTPKIFTLEEDLPQKKSVCIQPPKNIYCVPSGGMCL